MRTRPTIPPILIALAVIALFSVPAASYELFTGGGNCFQCHGTWPGDQHDAHPAVGCAECHGDFSNPVMVSTCSACHDPDDLLDLHGPLQAPDGDYCGYCHTSIATERESLSQLKKLFD